jgi:IS30 family transposase
MRHYKELQIKGTVTYGFDIKSITTDNGSEFWGWNEFCKSIHSSKNNIDIYFVHLYCASDKGGVENCNEQIRYKYPKGTDFSKISEKSIDNCD